MFGMKRDCIGQFALHVQTFSHVCVLGYHLFQAFGDSSAGTNIFLPALQ